MDMDWRGSRGDGEKWLGVCYFGVDSVPSIFPPGISFGTLTGVDMQAINVYTLLQQHIVTLALIGSIKENVPKSKIGIKGHDIYLSIYIYIYMMV